MCNLYIGREPFTICEGFNLPAFRNTKGTVELTVPDYHNVLSEEEVLVRACRGTIIFDFYAFLFADKEHVVIRRDSQVVIVLGAVACFCEQEVVIRYRSDIIRLFGAVLCFVKQKVSVALGDNLVIVLSLLLLCEEYVLLG